MSSIVRSVVTWIVRSVVVSIVILRVKQDCDADNGIYFYIDNDIDKCAIDSEIDSELDREIDSTQDRLRDRLRNRLRDR